MNGWSRVRQLFEETAAAHRHAQLREQQALRARQKLEAWYERVELELMAALVAALRERAAELGAAGARVVVTAASPRVASTRSGGFRQVVQIRFLSEEVLVYSARSPQGPLMVHWARVFASSRRHSRLLSVPGFRVQRGPEGEGEVALESLDPSAGATPLSVSQVACRILSLLAEQAAVRRYRSWPS